MIFLLVSDELLIGFELAAEVVGVALVDRRYATELLMIPWIMLLIRLHDLFCYYIRLSESTKPTGIAARWG